MPFGNVWSFPSREMSYDTTLGAMKALAERVAKITAATRSTAIRSTSTSRSNPSI